MSNPILEHLSSNFHQIRDTTCSASGQTVTCTNAGPLAAGASSSIKLTVGVTSAAIPSVTNAVTVSNSSDTNTANNSASDRTIVGEGGVNNLVPYRGGLSVATTGGTASPVIGYARIQSDIGSSIPAGLAVFGFRQNGILVSETSVPATPLLQTGRIYAEVNGSINTGLAIANPNDQAATISYYFTGENGIDFGAGSTIVPANGQIAAFLNQSPFNGGSSINGTFTFNSSVPVSAIALRGFLNERSEFLTTTLPVVELPASPGGNVILPHFADGGGWSTQVILVNATDDPISGSIQFLGQGTTQSAAQPVSVTVDNKTNSTFTYTIPSRSSRRLRTSGPAGTPKTGSIRVVPSGASAAPSGLAVFSFKNNGVTVSEAGVPALPVAVATRIYIETSEGNGGVQTGVAIANPSQSPLVVGLELLTLNGATTGFTGTTTVPGNGQIALFLNQIPGFQSLQLPFQGILRMFVPSFSFSGISVVGLRGRYNERGDFLITTTWPVNEGIPVSGSELLFPHFADGGGYTTQFVLFSRSPGQSSTGTLKFFNQSGQPLSLTWK